MKPSTRRMLRVQSIDPDSMGEILAEELERQEDFVRERATREAQNMDREPPPG